MSQNDRDSDIKNIQTIYDYPHPNRKSQEDLLMAILKSLHRIERLLENRGD